MPTWLAKLFGSRRHQRPRTLRPRLVHARYDAAATNPDNRRHWANADGLSANAANSPEVRRTLRNRARYEVANNSYAKGIVLTLAHDVIGTGPRLQLLTDNPDANRRLEQAFATWSKAVNLPEKLRTMRMARATDGEAFAVLTSNPQLPTPVQLDLRLIEADQVTTPDLKARDDHAVDGIVFDAFGNPVEYHVLKEHPGEASRQFHVEYDRIPATAMLHWFRGDRPGQAQGVPDITPALPLFAQLRRFTLAVIAAAETAADFAGILYTDAPPGGEADAAEPFEPIELEQRALVTMPGGWKMSQLEAQQPATTYAEFKHEILNEIARCLNMPFNVVAGNSSGNNYASGRLDHQTYFKAIRVEQAHLEDVVLDLAGLDVGRQRRPILLDHQRDVDFVMGQTDSIAVMNDQLVLGGQVMGESPKARQVIALNDKGFAWQASIGVRAEQVEFVAEGKTSQGNGREFAGPVNITTRSATAPTPNGPSRARQHRSRSTGPGSATWPSSS